jgi:hypothetical protein
LQVKSENCDILKEAVKRYNDIFINDSIIAKKLEKMNKQLRDNQFLKIALEEEQDEENMKYIHMIQIELMSPCESQPHLNMNETCKYPYSTY